MEFFFLLFLRGIQRVSGFSLDKKFPCPEKPETIKLSLWIFISEGFSMLVLLLEWFDLGIDLDSYTVFYVSVIWIDLDSSNDLTVSVLLILGVPTV